MQSNHVRSPRARLALAAGGIGALVLLARLEQTVADTIGGARGLTVAVLIALAVTAACGLASRRYWWPKLSRPAPVRLPGRARDDLEPAEDPELIMPGLLG